MPQQLIQKNGAKVWGGEFRAFGELTAETGAWENRLRFPGQYFDEESGSYYNYFRDYDPTTGRYLQSDPIGLNGGLNTYAYVVGNPIGFIDPLGLRPCPDINACLDGCFKFFNECMKAATWFGKNCVDNGIKTCSKLDAPEQRNACETGVRLVCRTVQNLGRLGCIEILAACTAACVLPTGDTPCSPCDK
jgi:RHS repeat-associated protein